MLDLPAGTGPDGQPAERTPDRRRTVAAKVRSERERLTSTSGSRHAFDHELLRSYALNRVSAAPAVATLAVLTAAAATLWAPLGVASGWLTGALAGQALVYAAARRFLRHGGEEADARRWSGRFATAEAVNAFAWGVVAFALAGQHEASTVMALFVMLVGVAIAAMLTASVPAAVVAATLPIAAMVSGAYAFEDGPGAKAVVAMTVAAEIYFLLLSRKLYRNTLEALEFRAEKDALIGELEQAKANSDEARRRAEEANLAKSRFLATMSHELRTPLNAILGFSEVMKAEVFGAHAVPTYKEYAGDIHQSGQHLLELINEILDLSRIEAGRYEMHEESVRLAYVVEDCHHLLKLRAKNRGVVIRELYQHDLPPLWADERALRQITLNLLSNAIKFTPPGGVVTLKVGWTASGGQYLSVSDTGPGIPESEIPTVLASFGQGTLAIKTAEQGAGLGLPIVKGLVDLHGGGFALNSRLREGTEVIVTLPASRVMDALPPLRRTEPEAERRTPAPDARRAG